MPDLRSFAQMKTSTTEFESQDKTLLVATWAEIMMSNLYYFKIPIFQGGIDYSILLISSNLQSY